MKKNSTKAGEPEGLVGLYGHTYEKVRPKKVRPKPDVAMDRFLRGFTTSLKDIRAKLSTIIKFKEELGPEWCSKVAASLDDIIGGYQHLRDALEKGNSAKRTARASDLKSKA